MIFFWQLPAGAPEDFNISDPEIYGRQVMEMQSTFYHISYAILRNSADSQDAVCETIAKGFEKISQLRDQKLFKAWILRILKNECYTILRKKKRVIPTEDIDARSWEDTYDYDADLDDALHMLLPQFRLTLVLHYLEGYSVEQISYIMGVPQGTVKSRLSRARDQLAILIREKRQNYERI